MPATAKSSSRQKTQWIKIQLHKQTGDAAIDLLERFPDRLPGRIEEQARWRFAPAKKSAAVEGPQTFYVEPPSSRFSPGLLPELLISQRESMYMQNHIWLFFTAFLFFSFFHTQGITLGYHRLLSHRSLRVPKLVEYFFVAGAYLAFEGSPIFWVTTHRLHHRYSDHPGDPHTPLDGFFHAFISWMWAPKVIITKEESKLLAPDLYRDPIYKMLHCNHSSLNGYLCLLVGVIFRAGIFLLFGPVVLAANLLATLIAFIGPLLVNTICHMKNYGYETYKCGDGSRNVFIVAMVAAGEGWHNNHHTFPQSARHGLTPKEFDLTWLTISILEKFGLAKKVRLPKKESHLFVAENESVLTR